MNDLIVQKCCDFIKSQEGRVVDQYGHHVVYLDQAGFPTIGYGSRDITLINLGKISEEQAIIALRNRIYIILQWIEIAVGLDIFSRLNPNQLIALVSLYYNLGDPRKTPRLIEKLKNLDFDGACLEFADCNKITISGNKVVSRGLDARRKREMELFKHQIVSDRFSVRQ